MYTEPTQSKVVLSRLGGASGVSDPVRLTLARRRLKQATHFKRLTRKKLLATLAEPTGALADLTSTLGDIATITRPTLPERKRKGVHEAIVDDVVRVYLDVVSAHTKLNVRVSQLLHDADDDKRLNAAK